MRRKYSIIISDSYLFCFILSIILAGFNGEIFASPTSGVTPSGRVVADEAGIEQRTIRVTGTVISATDGSPLPGLSIVIKGTSQGTVTGLDGKYSINVPEEGTLVFSFLGFHAKELEVDGRNTINVEMVEAIETLDELVVTALGIKREE